MILNTKYSYSFTDGLDKGQYYIGNTSNPHVDSNGST